MIEETQEDFGRDDRNFHPEEQQIIWETMENKEPAINQQFDLGTSDSKKYNYHDQTDSEDDLDNTNRKDQDIELDKELKDYSDKDFDKKDKSDL
jgi:hypothetical protein